MHLVWRWRGLWIYLKIPFFHCFELNLGSSLNLIKIYSRIKYNPYSQHLCIVFIDLMNERLLSGIPKGAKSGACFRSIVRLRLLRKHNSRRAGEHCNRAGFLLTMWKRTLNTLTSMRLLPKHKSSTETQ